jgi:hypothetical protein
MRRIGVIVALGALLSMLGGVATASPALADTGTRQLHLAATSANFTSFTCLNALCTLGEATVVANARSNLSTATGSYQADLIVDFLGQPAPGGNCNIVDEHAVFTFGNGTILIHSHHKDCATVGLRIDTPFEVTGGTGDFAGAVAVRRGQDPDGGGRHGCRGARRCGLSADHEGSVMP